MIYLVFATRSLCVAAGHMVQEWKLAVTPVWEDTMTDVKKKNTKQENKGVCVGGIFETYLIS